MSVIWSILLWLGLFLACLFIALYLFYKHQFKFWNKFNVPHTNPSIPFGDMTGIGYSLPITDLLRGIYDRYKNERFLGYWTLFKPAVMIRDPELVKIVFVKDFMTFHDRGVYVNEEEDPLGAHLFAINGVKWRNLRAKVTPTFTSGKMKMMFPTLTETGEELKNFLEGPAKRGDVIEIKEVMARFTTDVISSCAFGIQTNSLKDPDAIFRRMGKKIFQPSVGNVFRGVTLTFMPKVAEFFKVVITPKEVTKFFLGAVRETMEYRKKNQIKRNDFMQLLIQLKEKGELEDVDDVRKKDSIEEDTNNPKEKMKITFEQAAAQAFVFFAGGFETSSTLMQFALYELSLQPEIQEKTRAEIKNIIKKHEGKITYEAVYEMHYLGRVIDEALRKYPPLPMLQRECNKDYQIPDSDAIIPKGTQVHIPVIAIHMDPKYYPDPERFDPDRFTDEEKSKRPHYAYLPFGEGPRNCIGNRFGLMQSRVGLVTLLNNFRFEIAKETTVPLQIDLKSFILQSRYGMNLRIRLLDE